MLRLDPQTVACLNVLFLLNIHSSMIFDELSNTGYFVSVKYLGKDLDMLVEEGLVVLKLEVSRARHACVCINVHDT